MNAVRDEAGDRLSRNAGDLDSRLRNDDIMSNFFGEDEFESEMKSTCSKRKEITDGHCFPPMMMRTEDP